MTDMQAAELWTNVTPDLQTHPREWAHKDGRPLTDEEVTIILGSGQDELRAAQTLMHLRAAAAESSAELMHRLADLVRPYFEAHPECRVMGDLVPHMTEPDRIAFGEMVRLLEATR